MIWLGIESSCDETACAILQDEPLKVLSNPLYSQIDEHALYGGVVPEIAARAHLQKIVPVAEAAVKEAGIKMEDIDAIAYTTGPGLMGPLLVGASFAKGLARDLNIPAYGMNHLEGHLAAAWLSNPDIEPPFLTLTVSGGHTELVLKNRALSTPALDALAMTPPAKLLTSAVNCWDSSILQAPPSAVSEPMGTASLWIFPEPFEVMTIANFPSVA